MGPRWEALFHALEMPRIGYLPSGSSPRGRVDTGWMHPPDSTVAVTFRIDKSACDNRC